MATYIDTLMQMFAITYCFAYSRPATICWVINKHKGFKRLSCENNVVKILKDAGHRPTPQRLMIFSAVRHSKGHVTASEVLESVKESYPYIDLSTVYRTLDMYKQMHLISGTNLGGESYAYEWIDQTGHHHLVCKVCENITELNETFMDHLSAEIDEKFGFTSDIEHFAIFGTCKKCQ